MGYQFHKVLTSGTSINVGTITATAATDNTVTAVILPGDGQTKGNNSPIAKLGLA